MTPDQIAALTLGGVGGIAVCVWLALVVYAVSLLRHVFRGELEPDYDEDE